MSTTYDVIVKFSTTGSLDASIGGAASKSRSMEGSLNRSQGAMSAIGESARTVGSRFAAAGGVVADAFTGTVEKALGVVESIGKAGAVAAMGALAYGVVGVNAQLEKTQISLAAIFSANGVSNFSNGMVIAADQMAKMRADAAALPGETKDLVQIFKMAAVPAFQAGATVDQVRNIAGLAMAAGATMDLPMDQVARETAMMLQGRGGSHNILAMDMGIDGHALHKASPEERMKIVTAALGKFAPALAAFETSWDGITSTFKDAAVKLLGTATLPLFDRIKGLFAEGNKYLTASGNSLENIANVVGYKLADAFSSAVNAIRSWYPALEQFARNASARISEIWDKLSGGNLGDRAKSFLGNPDSIDKIESVLKLYAAVKIGGPLLGAAGGMAGDMGGIASKAAGVMGAGAGAGPIGLGVAAAALFELALAAVATYGAVSALTDSTSVFNEYANMLWYNIGLGVEKVDSALSSFGGVSGAAKMLAESLGVVLLEALAGLASAAGAAADMIVAAGTTMSHILMDGRAALGLLNPEKPEYNPRDDTTIYSRAVDAAAAAETVNSKKGGMKAGGGGGGGGTNMTVNITVNQNDDPSRVARSVVDKLIEAKRNPRSSPYTPDYSSARRP